MSNKKPYTNTVLLVKGSGDSCTFQGSLGGMKINGSLGQDGIVSNTNTEVKTGLLESNAQETELFKLMDGILEHSPLRARW